MVCTYYIIIHGFYNWESPIVALHYIPAVGAGYCEDNKNFSDHEVSQTPKLPTLMLSAFSALAIARKHGQCLLYCTRLMFTSHNILYWRS